MYNIDLKVAIQNLHETMMKIAEQILSCTHTPSLSIILIDIKVDIKPVINDLRNFLNNIVLADNDMVSASLLSLQELQTTVNDFFTKICGEEVFRFSLGQDFFYL